MHCSRTALTADIKERFETGRKLALHHYTLVRYRPTCGLSEVQPVSERRESADRLFTCGRWRHRNSRTCSCLVARIQWLKIAFGTQVVTVQCIQPGITELWHGQTSMADIAQYARTPQLQRTWKLAMRGLLGYRPSTYGIRITTKAELHTPRRTR